VRYAVVYEELQAVGANLREAQHAEMSVTICTGQPFAEVVQSIVLVRDDEAGAAEPCMQAFSMYLFACEEQFR